MAGEGQMLVMGEISIEGVQVAVAGHYRTSFALREVTEALKAAGCEPWLFGGAIRDLVVGRHPRDLDIIVTGDAEKAKAVIVVLTRHYPNLALASDYTVVDPTIRPAAAVDGSRDVMAKLRIEGETVEVWHVSTQRVMRDLEPEKQTADRIPKTTFLTTEAVVAMPAATPHDVAVHEAGFVRSMNAREIGMRPEWKYIINRGKFAVKALSTLERLPGYELSPCLAAFVASTLAALPMHEFLELQRERMEGIGDYLEPSIVQEYVLGTLANKRLMDEGFDRSIEREVGNSPPYIAPGSPPYNRRTIETVNPGI